MQIRPCQTYDRAPVTLDARKHTAQQIPSSAATCMQLVSLVASG